MLDDLEQWTRSTRNTDGFPQQIKAIQIWNMLTKTSGSRISHRWGSNPKGGTPTYYVGKISWKLHENVDNWSWGGTLSIVYYVDPHWPKYHTAHVYAICCFFLLRQNCRIFLGLDFFSNLEQGIACTYNSRKTIWDRIHRSCHPTLHRTQSP